MSQMPRTKQKRYIFYLAGIFFWVIFHFSYGAQDNEIIVEEVSKRIDSYPKYKNWQVTVHSTETRLDKSGEPQEVTVATRKVRVIDSEREEEILKVLKTKKGMTTDITEKYREEARERREKMKKRQAQRREEKSEEKQSLEIAMNELFPFGEERRMKYDFIKLGDSFLDEKPVYILEARLKDEFKNKAKREEKKEDKGEPLYEPRSKEAILWEGKYYIDAKTWDVLKLEVMPAKKQKFVQKFELEMNFALLENGYFVIQKVRTVIKAGFLFKHIRMRLEEEYSDFEVFDSNPLT